VKFRSRSQDAMIRVYDEAGNVIETHRHKRDLKRDEIPVAAQASWLARGIAPAPH
jgi:hypothetical protein